MTLDELRFFVALASSSSITEAGKRVGLRPAGASASLQRLEARARVRLVERSTRSLRLTAEGARFLQTCKEMLAVWEDGERALSEARDKLAGELRVAAPRDLGERFVSGWIADFVHLHPGVRITLLTDDALHRIPADDVDVAIRYGTMEDPGLVVRQLAVTERILVASPAYLERDGIPVTPDDLRSHRTVTWIRDGRAFTRWSLSRDGDQRTMVVRPTLCSDAAQVRRWAVQGCGIALKAALDVQADVDAGRLVRVLPDWTGERLPLIAVTPGRRYRTARVAALLDDFVAKVQAYSLPTPS